MLSGNKVRNYFFTQKKQKQQDKTCPYYIVKDPADWKKMLQNRPDSSCRKPNYPNEAPP
jgi:hypothetical protein